MKNGLPGLPILAAFMLAGVLVVWLGIAGPIWIAAVESDSYSDWLGFAGNLVGALITLAAAGIAWRAAQGQIRFARQQSAVVAHDALTQMRATLVAEEPIVWELKQMAFDLHSLFDNIADRLTDTPHNQRTIWIERLRHYGTNADNLEPMFRELQHRPWGTAEQRKLRRSVAWHAQWFSGIAQSMASSIEGLDDRGSTWTESVVIRAKNDSSDFKQAEQLSNKLFHALGDERERIEELLDRNFATFAAE